MRIGSRILQASDKFIHSTFVRLDGVVTGWGGEPMKGALQVQSRTVVLNALDLREGATAAAIFTNSTARPINAARTKTNLTYVYYAAKLAEANVSSLNIEGDNYFLNGTWNVYNVTESFNVTTDLNGHVTGLKRSSDVVSLASKKYGELAVTDNWRDFTLTIGDLKSISGSNYRQRASSASFNPFIVNDNGANVVTKSDLNTLAKAYRASPGWGDYDLRMDYNCDQKIDITDLATAAANVNVS